MNQPNPPPYLKDRYRLVEHLGGGRMGVVYRAHDKVLDRNVAIKFLLPAQIPDRAAADRFLREARTVARLSHPHIMALYDVDREEAWHYLVLEYIPGKDLHALMVEHGGRLPLDQALHSIAGVLEALAYAHAHGVIHRDVKPGNILCTPDGQIKVADFGLALAHGDVRLTQAGTLVGTILYMAPEMLVGGEVDARTDLYAVGAVLYELLAGQPPFYADDPMAVISQVLHAPIPPLRSVALDVPVKVEHVVNKLLAKDPLDRYASADEVLTALPRPLKPASEAPRPRSPGRPGYKDLSAAIEAERRRLAGLLQREAIEPLNLLLSQARVYEQSLGANPQARMAVSVLTSLARQSLQQVRDLEADLYPTTLEALGLEPALEVLASQKMRSCGLQITLSLERLAERPPPPVELVLFRAVQDALERAIQQAHAGQVTIRLEQRQGHLGLRFSDDGAATVGMELLHATHRRIEELGGLVETTVDRHGAFQLAIQFPLRPPAELSPREMEVLQRLSAGLSNKEIAQALSISPRTVEFHLNNLYGKLGVSSRTEAVVYALQQGWVSPPMGDPG